jgi:hypothetical protein
MDNESVLKINTLGLESLELKFKNKLIEYQNAYTSYLSRLNNTSAIYTNQLKIVPNSVYNAPPVISVSTVNSPEVCMALCSANPSCKSALYNSKMGSCTLQSGSNGVLINDSSGTNSSIIMNTTSSLQDLKKMNDELISMNAEINRQTNTQFSSVELHYLENERTNRYMIQNYQTLQEQREAIRKMMGELETIKSDNSDQRLKINQGVSKYIFWGIIALVTMFITVKIVFFPDLDTNIIKLFFNTCIFILLVLWLMNLSSVMVTFIILFLIAMIIVSRIS